MAQLRDLPYQDLGFAKVDHHRALRTGFPEVVFGEGKSPDQISAIAGSALSSSDRLLVTRASLEAFAAVESVAPDATYDETARAIVVVAGMEGALPSVVGGLIEAPVIAVPTSVGYGSSFEGLAALLAMLNSCAPGIGVVNIDNGFGAGYLAAQINGAGQ